MNFFEHISELFKNANVNGIPVPTIRDPKTGKGSISAFTVVISFSMCIIATLMFIGMALTKLSGAFNITNDGKDAVQTAFNISLQLYITSISFYSVRKMQRDSKGALTVDEKTQPKAEE